MRISPHLFDAVCTFLFACSYSSFSVSYIHFGTKLL